MLFVAEHNAPMEASVQHLNDYSGLIILVMKILALYAGSPDWTIAMTAHKSCDAGDSIVAPYHLLGVRGCNSSPWLQFMEVREDGYIWHDTLATLLKVSRAESILTCIRVWQRGDLSIMKRAGVRGIKWDAGWGWSQSRAHITWLRDGLSHRSRISAYLKINNLLFCWLLCCFLRQNHVISRHLQHSVACHYSLILHTLR